MGFWNPRTPAKSAWVVTGFWTHISGREVLRISASSLEGKESLTDGCVRPQKELVTGPQKYVSQRPFGVSLRALGHDFTYFPGSRYTEVLQYLDPESLERKIMAAWAI